MDICEICFIERDPNDQNLSKTNIDLMATLNDTLRKNYTSNKYEIVKINDIAWKNEKKNQIVASCDTLQEIIEIANTLESYDEPALIHVELCRNCKDFLLIKLNDLYSQFIDDFKEIYYKSEGKICTPNRRDFFCLLKKFTTNEFVEEFVNVLNLLSKHNVNIDKN